ncbi:MAG TPA: amidohydrolase family protein [Caulobacterales bacterium]|nr:amidohydrolase family protein [Caulobacterales bacterium]
MTGVRLPEIGEQNIGAGDDLRSAAAIGEVAMTHARNPDRREALASGLALAATAATPALAAGPRVPLFDGHLHIVSKDAKRYPHSKTPPPGRPPPGAPPAPGDSMEIGKTVLFPTAEEILGWMDAQGVVAAAAVQRRGTYGLDNSYVLDSADAHPDRLRPVVVLDAWEASSPATLSDLIKTRNIVGLRLTGGEDENGAFPWLDSDASLKTWAVADSAGLTMNVLYAPLYYSAKAMEAILRVAALFPHTSIVVDHLARLNPGPAPDYGVSAYPAALANHRNVYFKFTTGNFNVLQEAKIPVQAFMRRLVDRIGADRLLWGSNMGSSAGTYEEMAARARDAVAKLTAAEQRQALCDTGRSVFMSRRKTK